jgi:hypothetical protein
MVRTDLTELDNTRRESDRVLVFDELTERSEPPSIQFAMETSTFLSFLRAREVFGGGGILVMTEGMDVGWL